MVIGVFAVIAAVFLIGSCNSNKSDSSAVAQVGGQPTPPVANSNVVSNAKSASNAIALPTATPKPAAGGKKIPKSFTLGKDSLSEYGEVAFDHDTHAFKPYSPDGKSVVGCAECHHTDQPKSALTPPLLTSERDVTLTMETWQASNQKVNECRFCHFQDGSLPDDKTMPTATYTESGKSTTKDLNNELAYHINCNTCHDNAAKLRPELKKKSGFATTNDCTICHISN